MNDLELSADQWGHVDLHTFASAPDTVRVGVHRASGTMGKEQANNLPPGATVCLRGLPDGDRQLLVEAHDHHAHDNFVTPRLRQVSGAPLAGDGEDPNMGHLARAYEYGAAMGYPMACDVVTPALLPRGDDETAAGSSSAPALWDNSVILDASTLEAPREIPGALEQLPTYEEVDDETIVGANPDGTPIFGRKKVPVAYYWKEIARTPGGGKLWTHRGTTQLNGGPLEFPLTREDFDDAVRNFKERLAAGIRPFIPDSHVEHKNAAANNGEVIDLRRSGDRLMAKLRIVGSKGQEKILNNDVSVYLVNGDDRLVVDATGKRYKGRVLHHVALTPNPALPHLGPFQRIAASAGLDQPRDVPVFQYINRLELGVSTMACTPEETAAAKEHLSAMGEDASGVTAANAISRLIAHGRKMKARHDAARAVLSLSADAELEPAIVRLKTDLAGAIVERDAARADAARKAGELVALSADDPSTLRPVDVSAFEMNADTLMENAIRSGRITSADARSFRALLRTQSGKPSRIGLSASGSNGHPFEYNFWRAVAALGEGIIAQNALPRGATAAIPALAVDANGEGIQPAQLAEARRALNIKEPSGAR